MTTLGNLLTDSLEDEFNDFNLTEIQEVLQHLASTDAIDLPHAESLQQRALRGADIVSEYLGRLVKTTAYLESQVSSAKNKASLSYISDQGKTTAEMKKWAGESSPEVEKIAARLARAKGAKSVLEKKYDILVKSHHHYKEIAAGLRRTVLGYTLSAPSNEPWESQNV